MRKTKISADISKEAKALLDAYSDKHDRSKGWLLDRMIKKFCVDLGGDCEQPEDAEQQKDIAKYVKPKSTSKRFSPPTIEQVSQYCNERCNYVDAQEFMDHYTSNGWMRGKAKIKDWKACVRTWEKNAKPTQQGATQYSKTTEQNINTVGEWLNE
jgi:hypothetical protein